MRRRSVRPLATGLTQHIQAAGTLLRCLPADMRAAVLDRLDPGHRLAVLAYGGIPRHEAVARALSSSGDERRTRMLRQVLASDHDVDCDDLRRLATCDDFLLDAVLLAHPHLPPSLVDTLIRRTAHDPAGLTRVLESHSPGRIRVLLGAEQPEVVLQALIDVRLPAPLHDSAFLGAALRLWDVLGTDGFRDALDDYLVRALPAHKRSKGVWLLRPFLDAPHGRAQLTRLREEAARDGELARQLRRSSNKYPARDALAGVVTIDWEALKSADREAPFRGRARSELLARPDCPREFVPRLLDGVPADRRLAEALYAGTTTADEIVRLASPAWWLLRFVDETTEALGPGGLVDPPQLFSSLPFVYALLELDPVGALGEAAEPWLRLLRDGPLFRGTVPELLAHARRPGPVPPYRRGILGNPERGAASLVMTLAPAHTAAQVAARLAPDERAVRRLAPRRDWRGTPLRGWTEPLTHKTCLRLLTERPLDLAEESRPGSRWIWAAIGLRVIGAHELLRYARPAAAALEVARRCRDSAPAVYEAAEAELRSMGRGVRGPDAVDVWLAAVALLADNFSGTVVELTATARAAAVRN